MFFLGVFLVLIASAPIWVTSLQKLVLRRRIIKALPSLDDPNWTYSGKSFYFNVNGKTYYSITHSDILGIRAFILNQPLEGNADSLYFYLLKTVPRRMILEAEIKQLDKAIDL